MPTPTTQSGQAANDLIAMFDQAQQITTRARDRAARLQEAVDQVIRQVVERPGENGRVCVEIDGEAWQRLRACAQQPAQDH